MGLGMANKAGVWARVWQMTRTSHLLTKFRPKNGTNGCVNGIAGNVVEGCQFHYKLYATTSN